MGIDDIIENTQRGACCVICPSEYTIDLQHFYLFPTKWSYCFREFKNIQSEYMSDRIDKWAYSNLIYFYKASVWLKILSFDATMRTQSFFKKSIVCIFRCIFLCSSPFICTLRSGCQSFDRTMTKFTLHRYHEILAKRACLGHACIWQGTERNEIQRELVVTSPSVSMLIVPFYMCIVAGH